MKPSCLVCLALLFIQSSITTARDWYEYSSDNFTVYSDVREKSALALLRDMERFRAAALLFTGLPDTPESRRLKVFHFNSSSEFQDFTQEWRVAGFYKETWEGPLIFSQKGSSWRIPGNGVMFHEYIHHLMRSRSSVIYPMWYSEGFAELLASATLNDERISLGLVPEWRRPVFNGSAFKGPLKVDELLEPEYDNDSGNYWNSFYATAWLFTHYLQLGALSDKPSYHKQTQNYLIALHQGGDPKAVFEEHFGISIEEMEAELKKYRRGRIRGTSFLSPPYEKPIRQRELPAHERFYLLAEKAFEVGNESLSLEYLDEALELKPDWRPALIFVAVLQNHRQTPESLNKAQTIVSNLGIDPVAGQHPINDYRTGLHLAHYHMDVFDELGKEGRHDGDLRDRAAHLAQAAISINPESIDAHRLLWRAQKDPHKPVTALKTMMSAFQLNPDSLYINKEIGFYLAEANRLDLAAPFLKRVLAWSHPGRDRARAKSLLARFQEGKAEATGANKLTPRTNS
ncbi:hypothetical protein [Microbulbifer hydrolyticus]|uniref:Tetratricopeptide (TPR) repeat protein n=1 Tax=Microbulbifer hydrolyticus TaxID=48074 RepID=A0A6P1T6V1_9GAMM|nr:hypothetical protein [Microbulbifer hydrolyticus]MBB5211743.1 tetratricopeptide (TPR) repeat protein [Microbulbifer hydrolyticus]QHQ37531.1 hypothetical protein GTQ55_00100 [Microbulbifer hydrolyticus]